MLDQRCERVEQVVEVGADHCRSGLGGETAGEHGQAFEDGLIRRFAGAHWVKNVIRPKTYGLLCLTSPEMQLACDQVAQQGYYPPQGISGNHMMAELIGSVWGKFPVNRY